MESKENLNRVRFLEGKRVFLTPLSMADIDEHYLWEHDRELLYLDLQPFKPKSYEQLTSEFQSVITSKDSMFLSIIGKDDGKLIGIIMLFSINLIEKKAHWGIKLPREHWRQGYGAEAARLLIRYAFEDLGLRRLRSGTHSGNIASQKFQEKLGFVREGVLRAEFTLHGQYVDDLLYAMLKEEYDKLYGSRASD